MPENDFQKNIQLAHAQLAKMSEPDPTTAQIVSESRKAIQDSLRLLRDADCGDRPAHDPEPAP